MRIIIAEDLFQNMINTPTGYNHETGGYIGISKNVVVDYWFDEGRLGANPYTYIPDVEKMNNFMTRCNQKGIEGFGILHTHLNKDATPSKNDRIFIEKILRVNHQIMKMYFPIVIPGITLKMYRGKKRKEMIEIIEIRTSII